MTFNWPSFFIGLFLGLMLQYSPPVKADVTFSGLKWKTGLICDHPRLGRDLIGVIDNAEVFTSWYQGYDLSGHCVQASNLNFTLKLKWKAENITFDGYKAELWEVEMDQDGSIRWAVIFPDFADHRGGTDI